MRIKISGLVATCMNRGMTTCAMICAVLILGQGAARAEPLVTLTSLDGATQVHGELLEFDGETYTVRTTLGTIGVAAAQVTLRGRGLPGRDCIWRPLGHSGVEHHWRWADAGADRGIC
jgi:hypothetical protein